MDFEADVDLKQFNTFGISVKAANYFSIESESDLTGMLPCKKPPIFILGGGSNVLLRNDLQGTVIHNNVKGIEILDEDETGVLVGAGGGENWHSFVMWTLDNNLYGLENLSLIPGKVGAAPIQNIGAYGVEQNEYFAGLEAIELSSGAHRVFNPKECEFGYRDSFFKQAGKGKFCITRVYYRLSRKPSLKLSYGAISDELDKRGISDPTPKDVSDVVIAIRQTKLPDPGQIGNGGSFFKNPILPKSIIHKINSVYPNLPTYPVPDNENMMKISAAWLIDQCGWKGKRVGESGTFEKHALVLVNHGSATGKEVWNVAQVIMRDVKEKFGVALEPEINIW